jgi:hypothetical protein
LAERVAETRRERSDHTWQPRLVDNELYLVRGLAVEAVA